MNKKQHETVWRERLEHSPEPDLQLCGNLIHERGLHRGGGKMHYSVNAAAFPSVTFPSIALAI